MGVLDDPGVAPLANVVLDSIARAENDANITLSPVAREITALFIVGPALEAPETSGDELALSPDGLQGYSGRERTGLWPDAAGA